MENINIGEEFYFNWRIDTTPDYSIYNNLENYIDDFNYDINEEIYGEYNHNVLINIPEITTLINNFIYTTEIETEDFMPFSSNSSSLNINFNLETLTILSEDELNCCICMETKENSQICQLNCSHKFCSECIISHISRNRNYSCCPLCRVQITNINIQTQEHLEIVRNL